MESQEHQEPGSAGAARGRAGADRLCAEAGRLHGHPDRPARCRGASHTPKAAGTSSVTVSAADDTGARGSATFTWEVIANRVTVTSPGARVTFKGTKITPLQIHAADSDVRKLLVVSC